MRIYDFLIMRNNIESGVRVQDLSADSCVSRISDSLIDAQHRVRAEGCKIWAQILINGPERILMSAVTFHAACLPAQAELRVVGLCQRVVDR